MAITGAHIGDFSDVVNRSEYTWVAAGGDTDLAANKLYLLFFGAGRGGGQPVVETPTVTQTGATWVKELSHRYTATDSEGAYVYRTMVASPVTGQNIVVGLTNTSPFFLSSLDEFDGVDQSGSSGSGAIIQSLGNDDVDVSACSVTLNTFANANNRPYSGVRAFDNFITDWTPGLNTELWEVLGIESQNGQTQWDSATAEEAITTDPGTEVSTYGMIGVEIKVAPSGPPQTGLVRVEFS